jgi:hypothetical protein
LNLPGQTWRLTDAGASSKRVESGFRGGPWGIPYGIHFHFAVSRGFSGDTSIAITGAYRAHCNFMGVNGRTDMEPVSEAWFQSARGRYNLKRLRSARSRPRCFRRRS